MEPYKIIVSHLKRLSARDLNEEAEGRRRFDQGLCRNRNCQGQRDTKRGLCQKCHDDHESKLKTGIDSLRRKRDLGICEGTGDRKGKCENKINKPISNFYCKECDDSWKGKLKERYENNTCEGCDEPVDRKPKDYPKSKYPTCTKCQTEKTCPKCKEPLHGIGSLDKSLDDHNCHKAKVHKITSKDDEFLVDGKEIYGINTYPVDWGDGEGSELVSASNLRNLYHALYDTYQTDEGADWGHGDTFEVESGKPLFEAYSFHIIPVKKNLPKSFLSKEDSDDEEEIYQEIKREARRKVAHEYSEKDFVKMTGREPENDDLDRINCPDAGKSGHLQCGVCKHNKPAFECGDCMVSRFTSR